MNVRVDGEKLRRLRESRLMEREELQEVSGVYWTTIARIESGQRAVRSATAKKLAEALGVETSEFSTGEVVRNKPRKSSVAG